jgi:hypothetical protein
MAIRTVFTMAEDCARGARPGWREFVRDYAAMARALIEHYFPTLRPELSAQVIAVFQRARAEDNAWFRGLSFSNDREFLMAFRELVFAHARSAARIPMAEVSPEQAQQLTRDLTVVERELLWSFVKSYDAPQTAAMLMNAESTAAAVGNIARQRLAQLAPGEVRENGLGRALMELAGKSQTPACLPLKTFNNLINGQISWQERDRAEQHLGECLYCLDRFTSLQEIIWYARHAPRLAAPEIEQVLAALGFASRRKGLVARLFTKSA